MSYLTTYYLEWEPIPPLTNQIVQKLIAIAENKQPGDPGYQHSQQFWEDVLSGKEETSWDHHQHHMTIVSASWPQTLFTLLGNGDSRDDNWKTYYLAGRSILHKGQILYPTFNHEELRAPEAQTPPPSNNEEKLVAFSQVISDETGYTPAVIARARNLFRSMALNFSHKLDIRPAGQSRIIVTADNLPSVRSTIIIDPKGNAISVTETAAGTRTRHHPADKPILSDQLRLELAA